MDIQNLMRQVNKMKDQVKKNEEKLAVTLFEVKSAGGAITTKIYGSSKIESIVIDKDMIDPNDKEMLEEALVIAVNEAIELVQNESAKLTDALTDKMPGGRSGFGF